MPFTPAPQPRHAAAPRPFRGNSLWVAQCRVDSPLGPLSAVATARGLAGLWFDGQAHHPDAIDVTTNPALPVFNALRRQLDAYWQHPLRPFDLTLDLTLDPHGTDFQQGVWRALLQIGAGHTRAYGDLAAALGQPNAARAIGAAVGRNPISIIVPCHRVVGRHGELTGYAGGLDRKTALLELEGALTQSSCTSTSP